MRVIFLPDLWTLLLCFLVWALLQVGAALICISLPGPLLRAWFLFLPAASFRAERAHL